LATHMDVRLKPNLLGDGMPVAVAGDLGRLPPGWFPVDPLLEMFLISRAKDNGCRFAQKEAFDLEPLKSSLERYKARDMADAPDWARERSDATKEPLSAYGAKFRDEARREFSELTPRKASEWALADVG
jgi:hypothetical protein